jgi:hypothetical protein
LQIPSYGEVIELYHSQRSRNVEAIESVSSGATSENRDQAAVRDAAQRQGLLIVGAAPGVFRRVGVVPSGVFDGERRSGEALDGGSDWQAVRDDGSTTLDVRLVLKTRTAR